MTRSTIGAWILVVAFPLHAQTVYRWVDAEGEVHFSATPPPGQQVTEEHLRVQRGTPAPVSPGDTAERQVGASAGEEPGTPEEQAAATAEKARIAAERARNCAMARDIIATLTEYPARRYQQADGSYARYDDTQREARIATARAAEAANCD